MYKITNKHQVGKKTQEGTGDYSVLERGVLQSIEREACYINYEACYIHYNEFNSFTQINFSKIFCPLFTYMPTAAHVYSTEIMFFGLRAFMVAVHFNATENNGLKNLTRKLNHQNYKT